MKTKIVLTAATLMAIGMGVAVILTSAPPPVKAPPESPAKAAAAAPAAVTNSEVAASPETAGAADAQTHSQKHDADAKHAKPADVAAADAPLKINGYEVQDPMARIALNFVGLDPDADSYWAGAINDSSLPSEERKDLIEDLNEDGLADPHHPSAVDRPLILARIRLIERLAPNAMDDVNRDAFAEAYKDLVGMANGQSPQ